ncbi:phage portal protein [Polymorphum gilvum]|uniref:Portal protein GPB of phage lambda-like protein n=1 Tax=Polymorphum gilvum (strain LMG 25793 / CGMCC 1.9160 / SL003B-26A1) TaxID=991905 RepID=F2J6P5_POLGS|nr:phage portal protein [Polymorphum gilvum]ADZ72528.1 portal protein GPB of phage lambda-like protein [Polymorphum gilvum SL003B-26A1]
MAGSAQKWQEVVGVALTTVRVPAADVLHIYRPIDAGQIRGLPHIAPAMVRLFLLDQYDDAELDRKKTAAMFAGFITKTAPEEPMMGTEESEADGAAIASLEPGTLQVLLPGEDVKFSSPADVGGGYEAFQYRTLLAVSASLGLPPARPTPRPQLRARLFAVRPAKIAHVTAPLRGSESRSAPNQRILTLIRKWRCKAAFRPGLLP